MPPTLTKLETVFSNAISVALALGGVVLLVMLFTSGFKYLNSGGDPKAVESAQKTITYSVGGIVLLAGAFLILKLVSNITNVDVTQFVIYKP